MKKSISKFILTLFCLFFGSDAFCASREDVAICPEITVPYDAVKVSGEFRVVYCGASDSLKIIANDKVIKNIECVVEEGALTVRYRQGKSLNAIFGGGTPVIFIPAAPDLRSFILAGATRMECKVPIAVDNLSFEMSGASRLVGEVRSAHLSIRCAGAVNATLTGTSDSVSIRIDGASRVAMGEGFECSTASLDINGAGIVRINCKDKLTGEIAGTSVVRYLGKPEVSISTNGVASVAALD